MKTTKILLFVLSLFVLVMACCGCGSVDDAGSTSQSSALEQTAEIPKVNSNQSADSDMKIAVTTPDNRVDSDEGVQIGCPRDNCENNCDGENYAAVDCPKGTCPYGECNREDCPGSDCPNRICYDGECVTGECYNSECPNKGMPKGNYYQKRNCKESECAGKNCEYSGDRYCKNYCTQ